VVILLCKYNKNEVIKELDKLYTKVNQESPLLLYDTYEPYTHSFKTKDGAVFYFCLDYCKYLLYSIFDAAKKNLITKKNFEKEAEEWLKKLHDGSQGCTKEDYEEFMKKIHEKIISHTVYRKINGVFDIVADETIGIYTFHSTYERNDEIFNDVTPDFRRMTEHILCNGPTISVSVQAFDVDSAMKISEEYFLRAENILNVHNRPKGEGAVTIINHKDYESNSNLILSKDVISFSSVYGAKWYELDKKLKDPIIINLLKLSSMPNSKLTDIQKRVLVSIDWIGNGMRLRNTVMGTVSCIIAMESLLTSKGDKTISPAIAAQLRDGIAYILCDGVNDRLAMHKTIQELYAIRSDAVHGVCVQTVSNNFAEAYGISNRLIDSFVTSVEINEMKHFEELEKFILRKRYE
jgi:hypothetical protein